MLIFEDCLRPELGVFGLDFGFLSLSDVIVVHLGRLTCCLFCTQLGNACGNGKDIGAVLEQGEFDDLGVEGELKSLNVEGVDTGAFTVELVLAGIAVRLGTDCDKGVLGTLGIGLGLPVVHC